MKNLACWALVLAYGLLFSSTADSATVRGRIVHSDGSPVAFVRVRLNADTRGPSGFSLSGGDGKWLIAGVPPGNYQIEVILADDKPILRQSVTVQEPLTEVTVTTP